MLINGKNYSWVNLKLVIFGVPVIGVTEINFSEKQMKVNNYGFGNQPVSRGSGNISYEGDLTVFIEEVRALNAAAPDGKLINIPPFSATLIYSGDGVNFATDVLSNIEFTENNFGGKQNDSLMTVKLPFIFAGLKQI